MHGRRMLKSAVSSVLVLLAALFVSPAPARAQAPAPWSGIAADEAHRGTPSWSQGSNDMSSHSLSADGRYILFHSTISTLVPNDNNGWNDVFLRDRVTGELTRVSVASDGTEGNNQSGNPVISANGRFIAFSSCATNLDPTDTNGACDVFIHDRIEHTTTRQSFGPNGEQATIASQHQFRLSGDGRYLVFNASFDAQGWSSRRAYLRDRDPDGNGVFDEPGLATTTLLSESWVGQYFLDTVEDVAISNDGRYVAYVADTILWESGVELGQRVFVHDRIADITFRVDVPGPSNSEVNAYASAPDFSEAGHLAYSTSAPLVENDLDGQDDVYVINLLTGGNVLVEVTQLDPQAWNYVWAPAISADGRYVAVMTGEITPWYSWNYNVYGVDRQTQQSYLVNVYPGGSAENNSSAPSITADGRGIAFAADPAMLIDRWGNRGVFVATDVAITSTETEVPESGGSYTVELTAPATTGWSLTYGPNATVNPSSGTGSATIEVSIPQNFLPDDVMTAVTLGSEQVLFHQTGTPVIWYTMPYYGPPSGGTAVDIFGAGFAEGMTVEFGGVPATNVTFIDNGHVAATTPPHFGGLVSVKVTKAGGTSAEMLDMFYYDDTTPPIVTSQVTGTLGANGWYTSDVHVTWTVVDDESAIGTDPCLPFSQTTDVELTLAMCYAESAGGFTHSDVPIKRDTQAPIVVLSPASPETYAQGQQVPIALYCGDDTSGVPPANCTANQTGPYLDTSTVGTFVLSATAVDMAGHTATASTSYTVKVWTGLSVPVASGVYGSASATLRATLSGPVNPIAGKTIAFFVDNVAVGSAITGANGEAILTFPLAGRNADSYEMHAEFAGDDSAFASMLSSALIVDKATPVVTWANPSFIVSGTPLGSTQLNASASVAGSFAYQPGFSAVLAPGTQTLNVSFTPTDAANYNSASASVTLKVKAIPVITWAAPSAITYPAGISGTQLNATANTGGSFVYNPPAGTLLDAGTHTLSVTFNPSNTADYVSESATTTIEVLKGTVTINWPSINPIAYGTQLTGLQLNATASAGGLITYSPPYGTILGAGTHTLTATFTPNSPPNYYPATATRDIVVGKAYPVVYWQGDLAPIVYGTPLGAAQLYATSPNAGTITYNPPAGTLLDAGLRTITMTFTPDDTANYNTVSYQKQIAVDKQTTTVTWNNPTQIVYGTALGPQQLNATASQPGTYFYDPPPGSVLAAGTHTLSVYFTPTSSNYYGGTWTVTIVVAKRAPAITWNSPASIVYGAALTNTQLNASANTAGAFTYTPAPGTVLGAGTQTLSTTFEPSDPFNYTAASATTTIVVNPATPPLTWNSPGGIYYGTPLSGTQLNASSSVAGTFEYSPPAGTVLNAGTHTLTVTFTPADANYAVRTTTTSLTIVKAGSGLSWSTPVPVPYPTALSATQLNATAATPGTFDYSEPLGTVLAPGVHPIEVNFIPDDAANYQGATVIVYFTVNQTTPVISWTAPAGIVYGTALSATQLTATANLPGTFTYSPSAGSVLPAGTHTLQAIFHATDPNYDVASTTVTIIVEKATPVVSWATPAGITYGQALTANGQLNATANVAGSYVYSPTAGSVLNAGSQTLSVTFTPYDTSYNAATASVSLHVAKATPVLSWANPASIQYGTPLSSTQLNASASVAGSFAYSPASGTVLPAGGATLTATFTPADPANYNTPAPLSKTYFVTQRPLTLQVDNASKVYGQALPAFSTTGTGFVNGDTLASLSGTPSYSTTATATSAPGSYSVSLNGVTSTNYTLTLQTGTLTVSKASTSVAFTTTPNPSNNNQQVQLRAVVSPVAPGAGTVTGTVEFREGSTLLGTATLVNGVATINKSFKHGTHSLTATYLDSTNFNGSVGSVTHQTQ